MALEYGPLKFYQFEDGQYYVNEDGERYEMVKITGEPLNLTSEIQPTLKLTSETSVQAL